jgi:5,10-methenyltetrahydrofolate synthetase
VALRPEFRQILNSNSDRKLLRQQLIAARDALERRDDNEVALRQRVRDWLERAEVRAVGFFWPIRGEPDLRGVIGQWLADDARRVAALPVVAGNVLEFHSWSPDAPVRAGEFGIPVPARGRPMQPDCLLIPCVGFDERRFRLGYGGGYYDRTLAQMVPWPLSVGIAFEVSRVATIAPREHDLALDVVITDAATY